MAAFSVKLGATETEMPMAQSISITPQQIALKNGESVKLSVKIMPEEASQTVKWEADNSGEYTIDDDGNLVASFSYNDMRGLTSALFVSATTTDGSGLKAYCYISKEYSIPESIEISQNNVEIHRGETVELSAKLFPENGLYGDIAWYENNRNIGFGEKISYHGRNIGEHVITAEYFTTQSEEEMTPDGEIITIEGKSLVAESVINVTNPLATIVSLYPTRLKLSKGMQVRLHVKSYPVTNSREYCWISSNPNIVSVDESGIVTAVSDGQTTVKVMCTDGSEVYQTCDIAVGDGMSAQKPNTLQIRLKNGQEHLIPISEISHVYSDFQSGESTLNVYLCENSSIKIPFADIVEITHIYDLKNAVESVEAASISINVSDHQLHIVGGNDVPRVVIYDITGVKHFDGSSSCIKLKSGIYIVVINGTLIYKINI